MTDATAMGVLLSDVFQSTLPVRGVTSTEQVVGGYAVISIHTPREGSDGFLICTTIKQDSISIHTPREGSDRPKIPAAVIDAVISIHTPREGSDLSYSCRLWQLRNFNPHSP